MNTPELDKILDVRAESRALSSFIDWLQINYKICDYNPKGGRNLMTKKTPEQILAEYFEIDLARADLERVALLATIRNEHN